MDITKKLACYLALLGTLSAQEVPDQAQLANYLKSKDARAVVEAARALRVHPQKALVAPLQESLDYWVEIDGDRAAVVRLRLLDALLATNAKLPNRHLLPLLDDQWAAGAALMLLGRDHTSNQDALLQRFAQLNEPIDYQLDSVELHHGGLERLAVGSMLAKDRVPAFCRLLLENVSLDLHVVVGRQPAGPFFVSIERPTRLPPMVKQLGPTPVHRLTVTQRSPLRFGSIAPGPTVAPSVNIRRILWDPDALPGFGLAKLSPFAFDGMSWLGLMSKCPQPPPRQIELTLGTTKISKQRAQAARDNLQVWIDAMFAGLIAHKCLTEEQAATIPHTAQIVVNDLRRDTSRPLIRFDGPAQKPRVR